MLSLYKTPEKSPESLVGAWKLTNFPEELKVEAPELYFFFNPEGDGQAWGFKIHIETEVEKENTVHWLHHLKIASNFLVVFFSKRLVYCGLAFFILYIFFSFV